MKKKEKRLLKEIEASNIYEVAAYNLAKEITKHFPNRSDLMLNMDYDFLEEFSEDFSVYFGDDGKIVKPIKYDCYFNYCADGFESTIETFTSENPEAEDAGDFLNNLICEGYEFEEGSYRIYYVSKITGELIEASRYFYIPR